MLYLATGSGMLKFDTQKGTYASAPAMESDGNKGRKKAARELRVLDMKGRKDAFGNDVYAILHTQKGLSGGFSRRTPSQPAPDSPDSRSTAAGECPGL